MLSASFYCRIFITKTSARSQLTRRSETEEAEDADEDKCTAKSDIVLALTWDGIQGLHTIIVQDNGMYDVYNLVFNVDVCQFLGRIKSELSEKV